MWRRSTLRPVCTILLLHRVARAHPLVVAANRDELYARPATPATVVSPAGPRVVAGLDGEHGGTWMGVNDAGLLVGLTNQKTYRPRDVDRRSRGEVVLQALARDSVAAIRAMLGELDGRDYNPFNLVYGDGRELEVAYARPGERSIATEAVSPGIHVLPNDRLDSPSFPKVALARSRLEELVDEPWPELRIGLAELLRSHELPSPELVEQPPPGSMFDADIARQLQALCIHTPQYGTRSATLAALEPGRVVHYAFAPKAPCQAELVDRTALLSSSGS